MTTRTAAPAQTKRAPGNPCRCGCSENNHSLYAPWRCLGMVGEPCPMGCPGHVAQGVVA